MDRLIRLSQINTKLSQVVEFAYMPDEDEKNQHFLRNATVGAGAVGATTATGYGLYKRGMNLSGAASRGPAANVIQGARALPGDVTKGVTRAGIGMDLLKQSGVRKAIVSDARSGIAAKIAKLAKFVKP